MSKRRRQQRSELPLYLLTGLTVLGAGIGIGVGLLTGGTARAEVPGPEGADNPLQAQAQAEQQQLPPEPPAPEPPPSEPGQPPQDVAATPRTYRRWRVTTYHIARLVPGDVEIFDTAGHSLGKVTQKSKDELDLEGSGRLPDGRYVNWTGQGNRYHLLPPGQGGTGTHGIALTPFRSMAVDQGDPGGKYPQPWKDSVTRNGPLVSFGTKIYIREFDGKKMPDGSVHDGWVVAQDTGKAIYGAHLDFFLGENPDKSLRHPDICHIWFDGIEQIPQDYDYGLVRVKYPAYKALRPPQKAERVA